MKLRTALVVLAFGAALAAQAQNSTTTNTSTTNSGPRLMPREAAPIKPGSPEDRVRTLMRGRLNQNAESVVRMPFGMYEVVVGSDVVYVDADVNYMLGGHLIDARTRTNLTEQKRNELSRIDFKSLPLDQAIKQVRGNGKRVLVTFEDPNCGFCRQLARTLADFKDITVYTFLLPILSQDSHDKAAIIWCSKDRAAAWQALMLEGKEPMGSGNCTTPLQSNLAMGQTLRVNGTPTLVFADGFRVPGYLPAEALEQTLAQHGGTASAAKK